MSWKFLPAAHQPILLINSMPGNQKTSEEFIQMVEACLAIELAHVEPDFFADEGEATNGDDEDLRLVIAISGGPDSTALLVALSEISQRRPFDLLAAHVNHNLRGSESDGDEEFCERLAVDFGLPIGIGRIDWSEAEEEFRRRGEQPPEEMLRDLRYDFLEEFARANDARYILTGHTLDDQAETVLFRLFRGTSPSGLKGMDCARELQEGGGIWVLRPMLELTKADCQRFLADRQIASRHDSSNLDGRYARNYIRNEIIPPIDERFPGWKDRLENMRQVLIDEDRFLEQLAMSVVAKFKTREASGIVWGSEVLKTIDIAVLRRVVARLLREIGVEPNFERIGSVIELIEDEELTAVSLSPDWEVRRVAGDIAWIDLDEQKYKRRQSEFLREQESLIAIPEPKGERESCSNVISWLNRSLKITLWKPSDGIAYPPREALEALVDLSQVQRPVSVRTRRAGDVIQPFGRGKRVRLKQYLHSKKASPPESPFGVDETIVLADMEEVLWIPGVNISDKIRVRKKPTHHLSFLNLASSGGTLA